MNGQLNSGTITRGPKRRRVVQSVLAVLFAFGFMLGGSIPAQAAQVATGTIGNQSGLTLTTDWYDVNGARHVLTVTSYFGAKTATSVHINSVLLCYSGPTWSSILVRPEVNREGSNVTYLGVARQMTKGTGPAPCTSWTVNKTYTKGSSGEVFRVVNYIKATSGDKATIAGYYR